MKVCPQNKDLSDNWPQWFEGLNNDMTAYASACNGELVVADARKTALFPQADLVSRLHARDTYVQQQTAANSRAIGRPELSGDAFQVGFYNMAFLQILWTQNETRRMPNPLAQFPSATEAAMIARGKDLFTKKVSLGGAGCADCHHNGNKITNGEVDDTFQDYNIHEPGVVAESTVDGDGPFKRLDNDYFFTEFGPPQDEGSRQNISSRNTKHLRAFWDSVPRWLHHGDAHSVREILLAPDSPYLLPGERGFNFRTVRTDAKRRVGHDCLGVPCPSLPVEAPITFGDGLTPGDGKGPILVSLDPPTPVSAPDSAYPEGRLRIDRLGSDNLSAADRRRKDQPGARGTHRRGDQGHARQDLAIVEIRRRCADPVPAVAGVVLIARSSHPSRCGPTCFSRQPARPGMGRLAQACATPERDTTPDGGNRVSCTGFPSSSAASVAMANSEGGIYVNN